MKKLRGLEVIYSKSGEIINQSNCDTCPYDASLVACGLG